MEPTSELKQAVRKYREGNAEVFTQLYEESSKYIYTCIYKVMGGNDNVQDAVCDIMQDTYVEISKSIAQLDNENSFLSWAGTIATRKCYAWLKKNKKYVLMNEEDDTFENLADDDNIIPEEVMQDREKQRLVREIIDTQLTEMQKLCIIAFYYNEQKQSEIAKELGIPENTVKTNLARAKAKIKESVLDLEKKQGTRLYSVAPFLLLLFKEDVRACMVPKEITASVTASVSSAAGAGRIIKKIIKASVKNKVLVSTAAVVLIGGTVLLQIRKPETDIAVSEYVQQSQETETDIDEVPAAQEENEYREEKDIFVLEHIDIGDGTEIDRSNRESDGKKYTLTESIDIYSFFGTYAGYTKPDIYVGSVNIVDDEWAIIYFAKSTFLVKAEDFYRVAVAEEETVESYVTEQPATVSDSNAQKENESAATVPAPVEEAPDVIESDKYTPEEAIAVYRSLMEAGGMTWDPSLKGVTSWGTGWIYLEKGQPEWTASTNLESARMGDSAGHSWTKYYLEVTSSDENAVYITEWTSN